MILLLSFLIITIIIIIIIIDIEELLVIQIQEALWRKLNNLKPLFCRNNER